MNEKLLLLLPLLMNNGSDALNSVLACLLNSRGNDAELIMKLLNANKPKPEKKTECDLSAIENFSGADIADALKILLSNRG